MIRRTDPDDTEGRALYRATANRDARMSVGLARKVKMGKVPPPTPPGTKAK